MSSPGPFASGIGGPLAGVRNNSECRRGASYSMGPAAGKLSRTPRTLRFSSLLRRSCPAAGLLRLNGTEGRRHSCIPTKDPTRC